MAMVFGTNYYFNGINSADYDLVLCSFERTSIEEINMGLDYEVENYVTESVIYDYGAKYKEPIKFEMTVIHDDKSPFNRQQVREIMRWMDNCKDEMRWLTFYDDEVDRDINYLCRITGKYKIVINGVSGLKFEVTCDSSYAYGNLISDSIVSTHDSPITKEIFVDSDDIVYPEMVIVYKGTVRKDVSIYTVAETNERSMLRITNYDFKKDMEIQIDNKNGIITTLIDGNVNKPALGDSFNGKFFCLFPGLNTVEFTVDGTTNLKYRNVYKLGQF